MDHDDVAPSIAEWDLPASAALLMGLHVGDFVIEERIGQGSFGAVYRARQQTLGREVVLKVLHLGRDEDEEERVRRFLREAKLASQLDHPYAAHVYAFGAESDGMLWIAMEMVRGTPLSELLEVQGPLSVHRFVPLFEKICEVVHTAHQQGIVHRDLKPANVMVIARAGTLLPKLLDLGIAKLVEDLERPMRAQARGTEPRAGGPYEPDDAHGAPRLLPMLEMASGPSRTRHGPVVGSPPYMAPEQWIDAAQASARTDQYALGILAYEALTGRRPFRAASDIGLAMAHASQPVPSLGNEFSRALDQVVTRALSKNPADRHEDVLEFARAVRAAAPLEPGSARLPELEDSARDAALARAPQPLADAVAHLEAARTPRNALDAGLQVVRVAVRLLGSLATAGFSRMDSRPRKDTRAGYAGLRRLRAERLGNRGWLEVVRALLAPFAGKPDAHPIPELVLLFFEPDGRARPPGVLDRLSERDPAPGHAPESQPEATIDAKPEAKIDAKIDAKPEASIVPELASLLPELAELLGALSFLGDYPLLVHRAGRTEAWMGVRRPERPVHGAPPRLELREGDVVLAAPDGEVVLSLRPLCQLLAPAPGVPEELFLFDGPGRHGARLTAFPVGFERHDPGFWDWYHDSLVEDPDEADAARDDAPDAQAPYLGLSAFSPADAGHYVGREREVEACVNRLRVEPLLAVVGPSGAGKSSFVQAGIIAALPGGWRSVTVRPGPAPLAQLAARLEREGIVLGDLRARLASQPDALAGALRAAAAERGETLLLVIDQFEELLTLCLDAEEQRLYSEALMHAARGREDSVRVVITLRDDFLVRAQQLPAMRERLAQSLQILGTPPPEELVRIVVEPARRAGYAFEDPDLPMEMVKAVAGEPGALALLSFTATKLWELRDRHFRRLRRRAYAALGGVGGALAQHAEETLARMTPAHQALVREIFRQVVTADGTRAVLSRQELRQMLAGRDADRVADHVADQVIEELVRARLLVASEGDTGEDRVELVHEALLSSWPRLVGWQREDAEGARLRDQLRAATRQWIERGRSRGLLWRGDALLEYRVWRSRYRGSLTEAEEAFARASLHEEARGRTHRRAALGIAFGVLAVGMVLMFALNRQATHERDRAAAFGAESRQHLLDLYLEQGRQALLDHAPMQSFAYLAEALKNGADNPTLRFLLARATHALDGQRLVLAGHEGSVWNARYSPDGARIATGGEDGTARIWDARTGAPLATLTGHEDDIWSVRFSPDGARLATASYDGTARVWDVTSGALLWSARHEKAVLWAGFSRDGALLGTASNDKTAKIWDAASGRLLRTIPSPDEGLTSAAFTPDGALLITGSLDARVRVWEVETGALLATVPGHGEYVQDIAISPDGTRAAIASMGPIAQIVSVPGGTPISSAEHAKSIYRVAFSPDGARLVTASEDRTAKVWDVASGRLLLTLEGHASGVPFAAFSPDGQQILTLGRDGTARTWDARTGALRWTFLGHRDGIWQGDVDASGEHVVTASFDGTARVWAARQTGARLVLPAHEDIVSDASLAPTAARIATIERGGKLRVWTRDGQLQLELETEHRDPHVTWSSDGLRLLTAGGSGAAVVWDSHTGARLLALAGHDQKIRAAAHAPDQSRIVTASQDRTAKIWDARTGALLVTLQGHTGAVTFAEFDPAGARVVTASVDKTARIWDAATGTLLYTLAGHTQAINTVHFSADGTRLVTAGEERQAMIWSDQGARLATLEAHGDAVAEAVLSPDGLLVVTAGYDGTIGFWEAASGTLLASFDLHPSAGNSAMLDATGELLLVTAGNTASLWDVASDARTAAQIQAFADCRVDYALDGSRMVRQERPLLPCPAR
jgi:WD40 repeat protein/serine/threonine protein kinase